MKNMRVNIYKFGMVVLSVIIMFLITGCANNDSNENAAMDSEANQVNEQFSASIDDDSNETAVIDSEANQVNEQFSTSIDESVVIGYEGEWYRANVASYQWARITISNWKEGESFDVELLATYADYGGPVEGTATFIEKDMAVLYDERVESFLRNDEGDHGVYFQFVEDSIIVTHDSYVRMWFGGPGIATAEGTYIQGEPKYTNCTDVSEIFTENELEIIQGLLGDKYEVLFENIIELGEIAEYKINNGHLWEAYKPPYASEWCHIIIYEDGRIYVEGYGYSASGRIKEFHTNSEDTEMPDIDLLEKSPVEDR